eukprot:768109-Hanusia_phi.AAC.10
MRFHEQAKQKEAELLARLNVMEKFAVLPHGENLHEELRKTKAQLAEMQLVKEISELHHKEIESLKLELQKLYDLLNKKMVDDGNKNSLQDLWNMLKSVMNQNSQLSQEMRNMQASLTLKKYESLVQAHPTLQPAPSAGRDASAKKYHNSRSNNQERFTMLHYYVGCNRSLRRTRNILRHLLCFISHVPQSLGVRNSVDITVRRGGVLVAATDFRMLPDDNRDLTCCRCTTDMELCDAMVAVST